MAEVGVKKAEEKSDKGRTSELGLSRPTEWDPFASWMTPSNLFPSSPFSLMRRFSEEMDRTFGRFFQQPGAGDLWWSPAIEVNQREGHLQVRADLPGLKPEDVHVEVNNDQLVIRGERKSEHEETQGGVYRSERRYGQFYRAIPLPDGASLEKAKAQFNNGVLEITLPVPQERRNRREIPIEAGSKT
jgi:HSP20 family protein